jgi:hypothetical protein
MNYFLKKILFYKIVIVFITGFLSRFFINYFGNNLFINYTDSVLILLCTLFFYFIFLINEFVSYFQLSIYSFQFIFHLNYLKLPLNGYDNYNLIKSYNLDNNNLNCKDKTRRFIHWGFCERSKNKSTTYKDFKNNWNPKIRVRKIIINDLKNELLESRKKLIRNVRTLNWFVDKFRSNNNDN